MEYKILINSSSEGLVKQVNEQMKDGFVPIGEHKVVTTHIQNRFRGTEHVDSVYKVEYSQTVIKSDIT